MSPQMLVGGLSHAPSGGSICRWSEYGPNQHPLSLKALLMINQNQCKHILMLALWLGATEVLTCYDRRLPSPTKNSLITSYDATSGKHYIITSQGDRRAVELAQGSYQLVGGGGEGPRQAAGSLWRGCVASRLPV